jgi:hypothetical protein
LQLSFYLQWYCRSAHTASVASRRREWRNEENLDEVSDFLQKVRVDVSGRDRTKSPFSLAGSGKLKRAG